jgi:hypothetical protein
VRDVLGVFTGTHVRAIDDCWDMVLVAVVVLIESDDQQAIVRFCQYRSADGRARDRGQRRQARKGNVRGVPGRGYVEEAQGGLLRRLARREAAMSELTPKLAGDFN